MILKVNPGNTLVISLFGHKILFDGYLIEIINFSIIALEINYLLFDDYLIRTKTPVGNVMYKALGVK